MENNNSYDWLAVKTQASDKTFADIYSLGVSPTETTLQSKDFYKKSDKVKEMFKTKDGGFDDAAFNAYYLDAEKSLNEYKKANFDLGSGTADLWEDTSVARALKAPIRKAPVKLSLTSRDPFTNLKVAQKSFLGLQEINKWSAPQKTLSEVAQGNKVLDGITGKELDYTPEDTGLLNMFGFFSEPLVLAQYDADVKDEKGKVIHKKGDTKFDETGLPRYETLAGRSMAGRQQLSRWNTLSKEGSFVNKFDFMDDDGFDKSLTGIIAKSSVQLLPFIFGGPVATAFKSFYIAKGLLDGGAEITKALDGIFNGPDAKKGGLYKFMNNLQGYTGNFRSTLSEKGQEDFFSLESLSSLAVDSVYQLMSQEAIGKWPSEIKKYQMAKALSLKPKGFMNAGDDVTKSLFELETYAKKYGGDWEKAVVGLSQNMKALEKYGKYSKSISTAYMAATSAVGISEVSEQAGLDARDKGFMYLGYMSALIPLFNSDIGGWVHKNMDIDELALGINKATKDYASKYLPKIIKQAEQVIPPTTLKGRALSILSAGKTLGTQIAGMFKNYSVTGMRTAAIAEGTEELTEAMLQTSLQGIYNGLSAAGIKSTAEDAGFDLNAGDIAQEYMQNFVGGALGGAIFHKLRPHKENVFKSDNMKEYVTEGHGAAVINKIKQLQTSGELGDTTLSTVPLTDEEGNVIPGMWKPVNSENPISQNDFIADRMIKEVKVNEAQRKGFNIMLPTETAESKNKFFQALVDTRTDTDLRDRIRTTASKIYDLANEISNVTDLEGETEEGMLEKKAEMKLLQKELEYLQSDESVDEYFRQGLFNIRTDVNAKFGVKTRQSFTEELIGKKRKYSTLSVEDKQTVDEAYETYRLDDTEGGIKADLKKANLEYERFQTNMEGGGYQEIEVFKQAMLDLDKYVSFYKIEAEGATPFISPEVSDPLKATIDGLRGIKYVPDFMWDKIKTKLSRMTSEGSSPFLQTLATKGLTELKGAVENGLSNVEAIRSNQLLNGFVDKMLGGKFNDLLETPEFKDLFDNKQNASNYSVLRLLKAVAEVDLKEDNAINEYRATNEQLSLLEQVELENIFTQLFDKSASSPILDYLRKVKFDEFVSELTNNPKYGLSINDILVAPSRSGDMSMPKEVIERFIRYTLMSKKTGVDIAVANMFGFLSEPGKSNLVLDIILNGNYSNNGEVISAAALNAMDISDLDAAVQFSKDFDQERVASPLRKLMKLTYEFVESEFENLDMVGYSNYLNSDEGFADALQGHINAVEKLDAMINAANEINPLVNDFRKNHTSILPDTLKGVELFELSPSDAGILQDEVWQLNNKLKHLQEVNEYNKNNILAKLLREDGLILASNVKTWQELANNEAVMNLLPEISEMFNSELSIIDYAGSPTTSTDEEKFTALRDMANFEHNIFTAFQKLSVQDKKMLLNLTFSPVNPFSEEFVEPIDGTTKLNDSAKTIYLAKVFGTSSMQFAADVAGEFDETTGLFTKVENALNTPFPIQDNAIRLAYFLRNSDPLVKQMLFNAYTYGELDNSGDIDFTVKGLSSIATDSMVSIWGDPGTGKTTAVAAGIIATLPEGSNDVVLLAPKQRQLNSLKGSIEKAGFGGRIANDSSLLVNAFLTSLGLKTKDGKSFSFSDTMERATRIVDGDSTQATPKGNNATLEHFNRAMVNEVESMFKDIKLYDSKSETQGTFRDDIIAKLAPFKAIVLDEFTHINPVELAFLSELISRYNATTTVLNNPEKQITIITAGDINQMGYKVNGQARNILNYSTIIASTPLTTSLRSGWDLINNPLIDIKRRTYKVNTATADELGNTDFLAEAKQPIKFTFTSSDEEGSIGMKVINKTGATTLDDISFITSNKAVLAGKSLVYVVGDVSKVTEAETLLKAALGEQWRSFADINIYSPDEVQGGEYAYAIIDAAPEHAGNIFDIKRTHEFLNTMMSRGTEATLLLNDGTLDSFVTIENTPKEKAINQKRLTPEIIESIKANKQSLLRAILDKYTPEELAQEEEEAEASDDTKPSTEGTTPSPKPAKTKKTAPAKKVPVEPTPPKMPTIKVSVLSKIFNDKEASEGSSKNIPGISATGEAIGKGNKPTDIMAYTTFSTARDFDSVEKLVYAKDGTIPSEEDVELILASYKSYLNNRGRLTRENLTLNHNFVDYFEGYDYSNPTYFIEAAQRGEENLTKGRSAMTDFKQSPESIVLMLKVKMPGRDGNPPLILTLGMLNDLASVRTKHLDLKGKGSPISTDVVKWTTQLSEFIGSDGRAPEVGLVEGKVWRSYEFNQEQLDAMSDIFSSRILFKANVSVPYQLVREKYPDFYLTTPQVVVAINLENDAKLKAANSGGKNTDYLELWQSLKGKSIAFITEMYPLKGKTPQQMLDIYFKQLELFNNDDFLSLSAEAKEMRIKENTRNGIFIKLDNLPNSTNIIPYRPNMVKLVKLDNPKAKFLEFREFFLAELQRTKPENLQEAFKRFDMPVYVKDRLVKSLMVIHKFLQMEANQKWFTENIIEKSNENVTARIDRARQQIEEWYDIPGISESVDPDMITLRGQNSSKLHGLAKMTAGQFAAELGQLLYNKDNKLIRGLYRTSDNTIKDSSLETEYTDKDLDFTLSTNKQEDFSGSILSVNAFQLLLKTKSLTFMEMIDMSLEAFGQFPLTGDKAKYSLKDVFPNGQVESVVVPANNTENPNIQYQTNFLAEANQYSNGFTFNFGGLQTPAYNIDFDKLFKHFEGTVQEDTDDLELEVEDKVTDLLNLFKGMEDTEAYSDLKASLTDVTTVEEVEAIRQAVSESTVEAPYFKTKSKSVLLPSTIIGYVADANGLQKKVTLQEHVEAVMEAEGIIDLEGDDVSFTVESNSLNEVVFNVSDGESQFRVEFNLANQELSIQQIAQAIAVEEDRARIEGLFERSQKEFDFNNPDLFTQEEQQLIDTSPYFKELTLREAAKNAGLDIKDEELAPAKKKDPMDNIRKIEKAELKKFDEFVEDSFSEALREVDVIQDYIKMYKEMYRHAVVSANIGGTEFDLSSYDAELGSMDLASWNRAKDEFTNKNRATLNSARSGIAKLAKLITQYKAC